MKTEFRSFTREMIPEAGRLLASRHSDNRRRLPLLPARFEDAQVAGKAVETQWQRKLRDGFAAYRNGSMVAYLLGEYSVQPWGRCGYGYLPGYSLGEGEGTAIMQDLYALLGDEWVKKGVFSHLLYISAADEHVIKALFNVGFGKERVDALLDLRKVKFPEIEEPPGITIRLAGPGDNEYLGSLSNVIFQALADAPYWHPTAQEDWEELREGWSELADDKEWTITLALDGDQAAGLTGFRAEVEADDKMLAAPKTVYLSLAATKPEQRGRGISSALSWKGLRQARDAGYDLCYTNWISPNLLASRHWPRYGFQDVCYRLTKRISPDISWTKA